MSTTRCFSCIALPFPRVVLGSKIFRSKNIQEQKYSGQQSRSCQESAIASPCNKPGRATTPVPAASCRAFSVSVLTSYIEGQCRLLLYCNTHFKNLAYRKLGYGLCPFRTYGSGPVRSLIHRVSEKTPSRKPVYEAVKPYAIGPGLRPRAWLGWLGRDIVGSPWCMSFEEKVEEWT